MSVERDGDLAVGVGRAGQVFKTPVSRLAVRVNVRRIVRIGGVAGCPVGHAVARREEESLAARPVGGYAEKVLGQSVLLRRVVHHALFGVVETNEDRAVGDATAHRDLARCADRLAQRQFTKSIAVACHLVGIPAVAAKAESAEFTAAATTGMLRRAESEIEPRPHVGRNVRSPIPKFLPAGILAEVLRVAVDRHIVQPQLAGCVGRFHHRHQSEPVERRSVGLVPAVQVAHGRLAADRRRDSPRAVVGLGVVPQRPLERRVDREALELWPARFRVRCGRKRARAVAARSPARRAVFEPRIKHIAAPRQTQRDRVRRAPFVHRVGIEESHEHVKRLARTQQSSRRGQRVVERLHRNPLCIVRRLSRRANDAAKLAELAARVGRLAESKILHDRARFRLLRAIVVPVPARFAIESLGPLVGERGYCDRGNDKRAELGWSHVVKQRYTCSRHESTQLTWLMACGPK